MTYELKHQPPTTQQLPQDYLQYRSRRIRYVLSLATRTDVFMWRKERGDRHVVRLLSLQELPQGFDLLAVTSRTIAIWLHSFRVQISTLADRC